MKLLSPVQDLLDQGGQLFNVKAYGGTGNGTTDDTAAIAAAISAASTAGGGIIFIPTGTYIISSSLLVGGGYPGGLSIVGTGWDAELKLANASNCYIFDLGASNAPQYTPGLVIRDLYLNCNGANQTTAGGGIYARGAVHCNFHHLMIDTPWEAGIRFYQDGTGSYGHHNLIDGSCYFLDGVNSNGGPGWAIKFEQADENRVIGCTFQFNGRALGAGQDAQIYDTNAGLQSIIGNAFTGSSSGAGVVFIKSVSNPGRLMITGNAFDTTNGADYVYASGVSTTITGNTFLGIGNGASSNVNGLNLSLAEYCTANDNTFYSNGSYAVAITDSGGDYNDFGGNTFYGTWAAGPVLASGAHDQVLNDGAGNLTTFGKVKAPSLQITTSPTSGNVLTSDSSGNATWQAIPTPSAASFSAIGATRQMVYDIVDYGAVGNGTTDNTTAIQAALSAANTAGGGIVFVPEGTFQAGNLTIYGHTKLQGSGETSILQAKSGTTGYFITNGAPSTDIGIVFQDVKVDGNSQSGLTGIYLSNTSLGHDSLHRLINVWVFNCLEDGIYLGPAVIETNLISCYVYNSGRYGYNFNVGATDNRVISCSSGLSGSHGFYIQGNNTHFTDCKAYYAGYTGSTWTSSVHGFMLYPSTSQDLHAVSLIGCEAQNNAQDGFHLDASASSATINHLTVTGCVADGNNEVAGAGNGFYLYSVETSIIEGNTTRQQSGASHVYGMALYSNLSGTMIGPNDLNGSTATIYIDSGTSGLFSSAFALPGSSPPSGIAIGMDGVFTDVGRIFAANAGQTVTANGPWDYYITESGTENNVGTWHNDHLDMHSFKIENLANGSSSTDAAAFGQIPTSASSIGGLLASNNLSDVTASIARSNLGLGSIALLSSVSLTSNVTGTLQVGNGGTGATTLTGLVKGNGTSAMSAAVAGTDYAGISTSQTLSSTFVQPRVSTLTASSNTYTPNCTTTDLAIISAPSAAFTVAAPSGTAVDGQALLLRIESGSTAYTPTFASAYLSSGIATLPTSVPASKTTTLGFIYDANRSKWICLALDGSGY